MRRRSGMSFYGREKIDEVSSEGALDICIDGNNDHIRHPVAGVPGEPSRIASPLTRRYSIAIHRTGGHVGALAGGCGQIPAIARLPNS